MKHLLLVICLSLASLQASALPIPARWTIDVAKADQPPAMLISFQGETIALQAQLNSVGVPLAFPTNSSVSFNWATNSTGPFWSAAASLGTSTGTVRYTWTPSNDIGAATYVFYFGITDTTGTIYRAYGQIRMRPSPGFNPAILPPPTTLGATLAGLSNLVYASSNALAQALQAETTRAQQAESDAVSNAIAAAGTQSAGMLLTGTAYRASSAERIIQLDATAWLTVSAGSAWLHRVLTTTPENYVYIVAVSGDYSGAGYAGMRLTHTIVDTWTGTGSDGHFLTLYSDKGAWALTEEPQSPVSEWTGGDGATLPSTLSAYQEAVGTITIGLVYTSQTAVVLADNSQLTPLAITMAPSGDVQINGSGSPIVVTNRATITISSTSTGGGTSDTVARASAAAASATAASALSALTNIVTAGGYRNASYWYLSYADVFRVSSLLSVATNYDIITSNITSASFSDKQMQTISLRGFYGYGNADWSVTPTNIASISSAGLLVVLTTGTARVSCTVGSDTKVCLVSCNRSDPVAVTSVVSYASDSGHAVIGTNVAALISGGTATWHRAYWSTVDHATSTYVRDTQCWARAVDLSGVVVSTDGSTPYWHGTLVTTQHIAMAKHAYNGVGSVKRFVGASGTVYDRTITAIRDPWYPQTYNADPSHDLVFGYLSSPLPTNDVAIYSILPASYTNQFPNVFQGTYGITYDQLLRVNVCSMLSDSWQTAPTDATAAQFYSRPYVGDSGRPTFLLLPGQRPVLLHLFTTAEGGSSFITLKSAINASLAADGAALTEADLSTLKNYHP